MLLLVPFLWFAACQQTPAQTATLVSDSAWQHALTESQKPELAAGYEEWLRLDPHSRYGAAARTRLGQADTHYRQALTLLQKGQPGAREALLRGKALAPMEPSLFLPLARALHAQENDFLAVQFYRSYLRHLPSSSDAPAARRELTQIETELSVLTTDLASSDDRAEASDGFRSLSLLPFLLFGSALLGLLLGLRWLLQRLRLRRHGSLRALALDNPELQPALTYLIGTLRHELLKHRIGAASQLLTTLAFQKGQPSAEQRHFLHRRLYGGAPLLAVWNEHLQSLQRVLRVSHRLAEVDPGIAKAHRAIERLVRAERQLLTGKHGVLAQLARSESELLHFDRELADLVRHMQRTLIDEALLAQALTEVRSEPRAAQVSIDEALLLPAAEPVYVAVYRIDLLLVLKNLIRNAVLAVEHSPAPHRIAIEVQTELLSTGEELVKMRVHDSCPSAIPAVRITGSDDAVPGQRGLDLVRMTLRVYGGSLGIEEGRPGFAKCVVAQLFRVLDEEDTLSDSESSREALAVPEGSVNAEATRD